MQIVEESLATVEQAKAYQVDDVLLVRVTGTKPTACHLVSIERSWPDVEPPGFVVRLAMDIRAKCAPVPAPFEVHAAFRIGSHRDGVTVQHAGGVVEVAVEEVIPDAETGVARTTADRSVFDSDGQPSEAVGYSRAYDLGEAIQDAVSKLPPQGPDIPDWLSTYVVVSIGAEMGGIGGFNHLKVVVRG